jgi:hypothetical protein
MRPGGLRPYIQDSNVLTPSTPLMSYESQGSRLYRLHGDHDQSPSNGVEHSPCCSIVVAHGHDVAHQPEVEGITDGRFDERDETWR